MKKLLLLTLVLLGGFSTVSAYDARQLYLCGVAPIGNGWGYGSANQVAMTYNSETGINTATVTISSGSADFVVSDGYSTSGWPDFNNNYRWDYAATKDLSNTGSFPLAKSTDGMYSNSLSAGTYKIVVNSNTMVMTVTKLTPSPVSFKILYKGATNWENLYIYSWENETPHAKVESLGSWPGTQLYGDSEIKTDPNGKVSISTTDNLFYTITVNEYTENMHLIICNNNGKQFDVDVARKEAYYIGSAPNNTTPTSYSRVIYFVNNSGWSPINVHGFYYNHNASANWSIKDWPGINIVDNEGKIQDIDNNILKVTKAGTTSDDSRDVYKIELGDNVGLESIIFNNGNGNQTGNIYAESGNYYGCANVTTPIEKPSFSSYSVTTAKEYTTYVTLDKADFTGLELKAYKATSADASGVVFDEVGAVPANTPLLLKGTKGTTYNVPVAASAEDIDDNKLVAGDGTTIIGGDSKFDYILSDGSFYRAESGTVAVGKAYLHLESDPLPGGGNGKLSIIFNDNETNGIKSIENRELRSENSDYYNLAGQKVGKNYKGIVIVNGKKMLNK